MIYFGNVVFPIICQPPNIVGAFGTVLGSYIVSRFRQVSWFSYRYSAPPLVERTVLECCLTDLPGAALRTGGPSSGTIQPSRAMFVSTCGLHAHLTSPCAGSEITSPQQCAIAWAAPYEFAVISALSAISKILSNLTACNCMLIALTCSYVNNLRPALSFCALQFAIVLACSCTLAQ